MSTALLKGVTVSRDSARSQRRRSQPSSHRRAALAAVATAASAFGVAAYAAVSQIIAVGTMEFTDLIDGPATVTMRLFTIAPGEVLPWHYHPGAGAYTVVREGTLIIEDGCGGENVYGVGQAFLEPPHRVHRGKNLTAAPVVTAQTFVVPPGSPTTITTGVRLCGIPATVAECKGGGWSTFEYPRPFASQGDCEQFVITGR